MLWNKKKKEKYDDEIVIGKIKRRQKKQNKAKIKNDYYLDEKDTLKNKDIQSKVTEMLHDLESFEPEIVVDTKKHVFDTEPKPFPFTSEEVFGKKKEEKEPEIEEPKVEKTPPVESLDSFFEKDRKKQKKLKGERKKKPKGKRQRRRKKDRVDFTDAKEENYYKLGKRKFSNVEDFISYLTQNYLEIDAIAKTVLKDEKFHGWVSKKSGVYKDAFNEFKNIKTKIEK